MEILILICLIIVIVLLLPDKIKMRLKKKQDVKNEAEISRPVKQDLIDIMGKPRPIPRHTPLNKDNDGQNSEAVAKADSFDKKVEKEDLDSEIPQEEPGEVIEVTQPDLAEEEEEWSMNREPDDDDGFAAGVTFEELDQAGRLIEQETLTPQEEKQVTATLLKVQGTELFHQLQNSLGSVSQQVRSLLDAYLNAQTNSGSSTIRDKGLEDFNIAEFI